MKNTAEQLWKGRLMTVNRLDHRLGVMIDVLIQLVPFFTKRIKETS